MSQIQLGSSIIFCFVGPTGSGKSSLCAELLNQEERLKISISATSRKPRAGEVPDQHYHFISTQQFQEHIANDFLFEWEQVHGNYYGTLKSTLLNAAREGYDLLLDIDIRGALNFRRHFPANTVLVFVSPPSLQALIERVKHRSSCAVDDLAPRLRTAVDEFVSLEKHYSDFDYFVLNEDFSSAFAAVKSLVEAERLRIDRHFEKVSTLVREFIGSLKGELSRE
jgi:guanylate kinase